MKKQFIFFLFFLATLNGTAFAEIIESVLIDDICYNLNTETKTAEVTYKNDRSYTGAITIPSSVPYNSKTYTVTTIGEFAFEQCAITSVDIPNSVRTIKREAFGSCGGMTGLTDLTIDNAIDSIGQDAFSCSIQNVSISDIASWCGIKFYDEESNPLSHAQHFFLNSIEVMDLVIPDDVTSISDYAFYNYPGQIESIASVTISNNVQRIGKRAFSMLKKLNLVTFLNCPTEIGEAAFAGCENLSIIHFGDSSIRIGKYAFSGCAIKEIVIPNNIISIGQNAFNCGELTSLTINSNDVMKNSLVVKDVFGPNIKSCIIGDSVTLLCRNLFLECSNLSSLKLPKEIERIEEMVIYGCEKLKCFTIPDSVKYIHYNAFHGHHLDSVILRCAPIVEEGVLEGNYSLESFYLPCVDHIIIGDNIKRIGNRFFDMGIFYSSYDCSFELTIPNSVTSIGDFAFIYANIHSLTIPESIISIGKGAFENSALESIIIPKSIGRISTRAFYSCQNLKTIKLQQGVRHIEDSAFMYCSYMESAILPEGLINIDNHAFEECTSLTNISIPNSVEYIGTDAFKGCPNTIENNLRYIGNYLIEVVDKTQESYNIKGDTKWIGNSAFKECQNIYSISIPEGVVDIGERAFFNCGMLRQINLPSTLTHIGASAFDGTFYANKEANWEDHGLYIDKYLVSVSRYYSSSYSYYSSALFNIKEGTYLVADSAAESAHIYELGIPSSLKIIGAGAFANNSSDYNGLYELILPTTLEYIGERAFAGNKIFSVEVPSSINVIGTDAFKGVTNILYSGSLSGAPWGGRFLNAYEEKGILYESRAKKEILTSHEFKELRLVVPNSVTKIHEKAFNENSYIRSIVLSANIEEIESKALYCYYLDTIYSFLKEPIAISNDAFGWIDYPNTLLYVPQDQLEAYYRADVWREFDIVPMIADVVPSEGEITISTTENEAIIVVEMIDGAIVYELTVSLLNGTLVATYTYNSKGELISTVYYVPSRTQKDAFQFVVSGLDSGTTYLYSVVAKDGNGNIVNTKEGTFVTESTQGVENVINASSENIADSRKLLHNNQIFILRNDKTYTITGAEVK